MRYARVYIDRMHNAYLNATIYTGQAVETNQSVLTENGVIKAIVPATAIPAHYQPIDLQGNILTPALIDLQIYGGNGKLFSQDFSLESLEATYQYCLNGGCTQFMITLATNTIEKFIKGLEVAREYQQQGGKGLLGVHLEGPYINPVKRGAHLAECIKTPTAQEINMLLEKGKGVFKMMTLAPEQCHPKLIDLLTEGGVLVSAGHSNATYKQATEAFDKGIPLATHLYNAMSAFQHREPGMVGAIFDHPRVKSSLVCDGVHVNYTAVKIAKKLMQERLFLITDAVAEALVGEYKHIYKNDRYDLPDGTLSGSALTMIMSVRNAVQHAGIPLDEALRMASAYPGEFLKDRKLGKIAEGYEAELLVINNDLRVVQVITNN